MTAIHDHVPTRQHGDIMIRQPDSGEILFGQVIRTIEIAHKLADEVIDCLHSPGCRCGDRHALNSQELAALELIYRCADMFASSPYPVAVIEGLRLPPRQFAALGCDEALVGTLGLDLGSAR